MVLLAAENWIFNTVVALGMAALLIFIPVATYLFIRAKGSVKRGNRALQEGRLAEALDEFKQGLAMSFRWTNEFKLTSSASDTFQQALDGIAKVYQSAGAHVDLDPLRELRRDFKALHRDKKYCKNFQTKEYTREGAAIVEKMNLRFNELFGALPSLGPAAECERSERGIAKVDTQDSQA